MAKGEPKADCDTQRLRVIGNTRTGAGFLSRRRCPFCKQAKGEIRKARGGFLGVCQNCEGIGPKRESRDDALRAWNGKG
jgi:hypothetical protein